MSLRIIITYSAVSLLQHQAAGLLYFPSTAIREIIKMPLLVLAKTSARTVFAIFLSATHCQAACNCTDVNRTLGRQDLLLSSGVSQALVVLSYIPIALYAEDLRVQSTLLNAILRKNYIPTPMTGCVKDIHRLWNLGESELYGEFGQGLPYMVASMRHGNTFPLVNRQVLSLGGLLEGGRERGLYQHDGMLYRSTVVNVSFLFSRSLERDDGHGKMRWTYRLVAFAQLMVLITVAIVCGFYGLRICTLLIACQLFNWMVLLFVHLKAKPIFGKAASRFLASRDKVLGGASLDTHIISAHANADTINVVCGYSSHTHSVTNIPIRTNDFRFIRRASRCLMISLLIQAAALVSLVGNGTKQGIAPIIWLALYVLMNFAATVVDKVQIGANVLDHQPGTVSNLPSMVFSGRKAALVFIAHLPVTLKANKWAWVDVFMPNNERRRKWEAEIDMGRPYLDAQSTTEEEGLLNSISNPNQMALAEVKKAFSSPNFSKSLGAYLSAVGLANCSQDVRTEVSFYQAPIVKNSS